MPPAARISDAHVCPVHGGPPIASGSADVIIGNMPAARLGDILACAPPDVIAQGSPTVLINFRQAARLTDPTAHGGKIAVGCPTVIVGQSGQGSALVGASASGKPFCEECEKARKALEEKQKQEQAQKTGKPPANSTVAPPPAKTPAPQPQITLKGVTPHEVEIAAAPGAAPEQQAARAKIARAFYAQHGVKYDRKTKLPKPMPLAEIRSHIKGIDFTKPVSFGPPPPLPSELHQWQMSGWDQGQYYAHAHVTPTELGIHPQGNRAKDGPLEDKVKTKFVMHHEGPYLQSTSAAVNDHWSVQLTARKRFMTKGGATQFYVPNRHHAKQA